MSLLNPNDLQQYLRQAETRLHRPKPVKEEDSEEKADAVDNMIENFRGRLRLLTMRFHEGEIPVTMWHQLYEAELRMLHLIGVTVAVGGFNNLIRSDLQWYEQRVAEQMTYLDAFRQSITPPSTLPQTIEVRAQSYAAGVTYTYGRAFTDALGMPHLPAYPGDGTTACLQWCKCRWRIVKLSGNGNWDAHWHRSPVESCPQCIAREAGWRPVRIRGYALQPYETKGTFR